MLCFTVGLPSCSTPSVPSSPSSPSSPSEVHSDGPKKIISVPDTSGKAEAGKKQEVESLKEKLKTLQENNENLQVELQAEQTKNAKLKSALEKKKQDNDNLSEQVKVLQKQIKDLQEEGHILRYQILIAVLSIAIVFLVIVAWVCWVRMSTQVIHIEDHTKCPFCGWEHDPEETVCRHCNTKFPWN